MKPAWLCFRTAARFTLIEQLGNRLALALVALFIPVWLWLGYTVAAKTPVPFFLRAAGRTVMVNGDRLGQLGGAIHALALIVGFMMFLATTRSAAFDNRLVRAGYSRSALLMAKYTVLAAIAALAALYTYLWITAFWEPAQSALLIASLFIAALTYGGLGVLLAAVLRSELAGTFLLIMGGFIDVGMQNPVSNPSADHPILHYLPTYGPMQSAMTAASLDFLPWMHLALGMCWATGTAAVGMVAFAIRTRCRTAPATPRPEPRRDSDQRTSVGSGSTPPLM